MNRLTAALLTVFLASCHTAQNKVDLTWKIQPGEVIKYRSVIAEIKPEPNFKLDGFEVLRNPTLKNKVNEELKAFKGPVGTLEATLEGKTGGFKAEFIVIKPEYATPPANDEEKIKREISDSRAGTVEILAELGLKGQLNSFYLKQKQRNLLALFFKLPEFGVQIGDNWNLPVTFTEIGQGFVPKEAVRDQEAKLIGLTTNSKGEKIAELFYVIAEKVNGQFEYSYSDVVVPISTEYSYFVNGRFNVNKGQWENFTAISYLSGKGLSQNENMMAYILKQL